MIEHLFLIFLLFYSVSCTRNFQSQTELFGYLDVPFVQPTLFPYRDQREQHAHTLKDSFGIPTSLKKHAAAKYQRREFNGTFHDPKTNDVKSLYYKAEIMEGTVSLDFELDVQEVLCFEDALQIRFSTSRKAKHFGSLWIPGTRFVAGKGWDCGNHQGKTQEQPVFFLVKSRSQKGEYVTFFGSPLELKDVFHALDMKLSSHSIKYSPEQTMSPEQTRNFPGAQNFKRWYYDDRLEWSSNFNYNYNPTSKRAKEPLVYLWNNTMIGDVTLNCSNCYVYLEPHITIEISLNYFSGITLLRVQKDSIAEINIDVTVTIEKQIDYLKKLNLICLPVPVLEFFIGPIYCPINIQFCVDLIAQFHFSGNALMRSGYTRTEQISCGFRMDSSEAKMLPVQREVLRNEFHELQTEFDAYATLNVSLVPYLNLNVLFSISFQLGLKPYIQWTLSDSMSCQLMNGLQLKTEVGINFFFYISKLYFGLLGYTYEFTLGGLLPLYFEFNLFKYYPQCNWCQFCIMPTIAGEPSAHLVPPLASNEQNIEPSSVLIHVPHANIHDADCSYDYHLRWYRFDETSWTHLKSSDYSGTTCYPQFTNTGSSSDYYIDLNPLRSRSYYLLSLYYWSWSFNYETASAFLSPFVMPAASVVNELNEDLSIATFSIDGLVFNQLQSTDASFSAEFVYQNVHRVDWNSKNDFTIPEDRCVYLMIVGPNVNGELQTGSVKVQFSNLNGELHVYQASETVSTNIPIADNVNGEETLNYEFENSKQFFTICNNMTSDHTFEMKVEGNYSLSIGSVNEVMLTSSVPQDISLDVHLEKDQILQVVIFQFSQIELSILTVVHQNTISSRSSAQKIGSSLYFSFPASQEDDYKVYSLLKSNISTSAKIHARIAEPLYYSVEKTVHPTPQESIFLQSVSPDPLAMLKLKIEGDIIVCISAVHPSLDETVFHDNIECFNEGVHEMSIATISYDLNDVDQLFLRASGSSEGSITLSQVLTLEDGRRLRLSSVEQHLIELTVANHHENVPKFVIALSDPPVGQEISTSVQDHLNFQVTNEKTMTGKFNETIGRGIIFVDEWNFDHRALLVISNLPGSLVFFNLVHEVPIGQELSIYIDEMSNCFFTSTIPEINTGIVVEALALNHGADPDLYGFPISQVDAFETLPTLYHHTVSAHTMGSFEKMIFFRDETMESELFYFLRLLRNSSTIELKVRTLDAPILHMDSTVVDEIDIVQNGFSMILTIEGTDHTWKYPIDVDAILESIDGSADWFINLKNVTLNQTFSAPNQFQIISEPSPKFRVPLNSLELSINGLDGSHLSSGDGRSTSTSTVSIQKSFQIHDFSPKIQRSNEQFVLSVDGSFLSAADRLCLVPEDAACDDSLCFFGSLIGEETKFSIVAIPDYGARFKVCYDHGNVGNFLSHSESLVFDIKCNEHYYYEGGVCNNHGSCIETNVCECMEEYYGMNCEKTTCFDIPSNDTDSVCSGHGNCFELNTCSCQQGYLGNNCEKIGCFGLEQQDPNVCVSSGECQAPNQCHCDEGHYGIDCSLWKCFETLSNESFVCSGHGECIATNNCQCHANFYEENCNVNVCFNIHSNESNVCSSNGDCVDFNECHCNQQHTGSQCEHVLCFGVSEANQTVCSGRGDCTGYNHCECDPDRYGNSCELSKCFGILSNESLVCEGRGDCIDSKCHCEVGFRLANCSEIVTCFNKQFNSSEVCSGNGICQDLDQCICSEQFTGRECNIPVCSGIAANDTSVCSSRGSCVSPDNCECMQGFSGASCEWVSCFSYWSNDNDVCGSHGECVSIDKCICSDGWTGPQCKVPMCYGKNATDDLACSGSRGECVSKNLCNCVDGYFGDQCENAICYEKLSSPCSGHGNCIDKDTCYCPDENYHGNECGNFSCHGKNRHDENVCSQHGTCHDFNECVCQNGYTGSECEKGICFGVSGYDSNVCSSNGKCIDHNVCKCDEDHTGQNCNILKCFNISADDETVCSHHGICVEPNFCDCFDNYYGEKCEVSKCFGILSSHPHVCAGGGNCVSYDNCQCQKTLVDADCSPFNCFEKFANVSNVCSGHGNCVSNNACECQDGFSGPECDNHLDQYVSAASITVMNWMWFVLLVIANI